MNTSRKIDMSAPAGTVVPKVNIGAIRGGVPYKITKTVQQCAIYLDVRVTPKQEPLDVRDELRQIMVMPGFRERSSSMSIGPALRPTKRRARLCGTRSLVRIARSWGRAEAGPIPTSSMWRDLNCFNEMRIPSYTYGPGVSVGSGIFRMPIQNLVTGSQLYVHTALDLCNQRRS